MSVLPAPAYPFKPHVGSAISEVVLDEVVVAIVAELWLETDGLCEVPVLLEVLERLVWVVEPGTDEEVTEDTVLLVEVVTLELDGLMELDVVVLDVVAGLVVVLVLTVDVDLTDVVLVVADVLTEVEVAGLDDDVVVLTEVVLVLVAVDVVFAELVLVLLLLVVLTEVVVVTVLVVYGTTVVLTGTEVVIVFVVATLQLLPPTAVVRQLVVFEVVVESVKYQFSSQNGQPNAEFMILQIVEVVYKVVTALASTARGSSWSLESTLKAAAAAEKSKKRGPASILICGKRVNHAKASKECAPVGGSCVVEMAPRFQDCRGRAVTSVFIFPSTSICCRAWLPGCHPSFAWSPGNHLGIHGVPAVRPSVTSSAFIVDLFYFISYFWHAHLVILSRKVAFPASSLPSSWAVNLVRRHHNG